MPTTAFDPATLGMQAASGAASGILGEVFAGINDRRQLNQQQRLNEQSMTMQKQMTNFNNSAQLQMWHQTNYPAQVEEMKKAGLNPALIESGGGGGGSTTANISTGNSNAPEAPKGGGEVMGMVGQSPMLTAQLQLLKAQKENIEADTAQKQSTVPVNQAQVPNVEAQTKNTNMDTYLKNQQQWKVGLDAAMQNYLQSTKPNGDDTTNIHESIAAQQKVAELMTQNQKIQEIAQHITLMVKQGMNIDQITNNLIKDGSIKDNEIEWNKMGLTNGDAGKFLNSLIHHLIK